MTSALPVRCYYYCYYYSKFCDNLFFLFFQAVKLQPCIIFIDEIGKHKGFLHQLMQSFGTTMQAEVCCQHLSGITYEVTNIAVSQVVGMFSLEA